MQYGGLAIHRELAILREVGLSGVEAIAAATGAAARVMRRPDIGVVEPGRLADLVVVDGDPMLDLAALRQIRVVLRGGEAVHGAA
jgi:imidazolonepropionase-like amidohydrolase